MRTARWSVRAQADLVRIVGNYGPLNGEFAVRTLRQAVDAADFLCDFPQAGPATRRPGVRKSRVKTTPFLLLYRTGPSEVRITRVAHAAQDWDRW